MDACQVLITQPSLYVAYCVIALAAGGGTVGTIVVSRLSASWGGRCVVRRFWIYASITRADQWKQTSAGKRDKPFGQGINALSTTSNVTRSSAPRRKEGSGLEIEDASLGMM